MPYKAKKPCSQPGCPNITDGQFCKEHKAAHDKEYDQQRGTSAERGYGANWQRLRKMVLARQPICEDPFGFHKEYNETVAANEVDHITPLADGGSNEMINLQALCKPCHSTKTAAIDGRW